MSFLESVIGVNITEYVEWYQLALACPPLLLFVFAGVIFRWQFNKDNEFVLKGVMWVLRIEEIDEASGVSYRSRLLGKYVKKRRIWEVADFIEENFILFLRVLASLLLGIDITLL